VWRLATVLLLAVAAASDEIDEARRLLSARDSAGRRRAFELLERLDRARSVDLIEEAIERSLRQLDRLSGVLDRQDDRIIDDYIVVLNLIDSGDYHSQHYRQAEAALAASEQRQKLTLDEAAVELRTIHSSLRTLRRFRSEEALREIEKGARSDSNPTARVLFLLALGRPECSESIPVLLGALGQPDPRFLSAALRALVAHAGDPTVQQAVVPLFAHEHWAVRLGAYRVLACGPPVDAIAGLVAAVAREEGEIAFACDSYLEDLTGVSFQAEPSSWGPWWRENEAAVRGGTFVRGGVRPEPTEVVEEPEEPEESVITVGDGSEEEEPEETDDAEGGRGEEPPPPPVAGKPAEPVAPQRTVARFFRIPIESRRIVFAVDFSGSMDEPLEGIDERTKAALSKYGLPPTRLGVAKVELVAAIRGLPDGALFNIVVYDDKATSYQARLVKATKSARESAVKWILKRDSRYMTNLWGALREAFRDYLEPGGGGARFADLPDTIVFLTDGHATRGRFRETASLRDCFDLWNLSVDVVMHCVGVGSDQDRELLVAMAGATGGYYIDPQVGMDSIARRRRLPAAGPAESGAR